METQFLNVEYLFFLIYQLLTGAGEFGNVAEQPTRLFQTELYQTLSTIWFVYVLIATLVTLLLLTILIYSIIRLQQIRKAEEEYYESAMKVAEDAEPYTNTQWEHVEQLMHSGNENDWRQAIIEADIMLDAMLTGQGYDGISVGDKLKMIEPSDFKTLQDAWDAHKIRNRIAHDGAGFDLTKREADMAIAAYKRVFDEFYYV